MAKTKIEWSEHSWNPVTGCSGISEGCRMCYARRMARRLAGRYGYPEYPNHFDVTLHPDRLEIPLKRKKPTTYFICSMSDLFHEDVNDEFIAVVFGVMAAANQHTYQVLTKRPGRMLDLLGHRAKMMATKVDLYKHVALIGRIGEVFAAERIKSVKGWPGYFVTTKGRILSDRNHGGNRDADTIHEMKPQVGLQGHSRIELQVNGVSTRPLIHRLVLESFDRSARIGEQSCHIDGDATNNCLWNLRWGSQSDNWEDSKRHGTHRRHSKVNSNQVAEIRERLKVGESAHAIALGYNISSTQIQNIRRGDQWKPEYTSEWPLCSVWLGVSVENQATADKRIPLLLQIPAAVRFVSLEPLLGPIDLEHYLGIWTNDVINLNQRLTIGKPMTPNLFTALAKPKHHARLYEEQLSWIIAGGESGPGARPMNPDWVRGIRDQCQSAGVSFFFKQHGAWIHTSQLGRCAPELYDPTGTRKMITGYAWPDRTTSYYVGKKAAGRLLDGREWNEMPGLD